MITPVNGRVVWFHPSPGGSRAAYRGQPLAAQIVHVFTDRLVNLVVHDANGMSWPIINVQLLQNGDAPNGGAYAEWMPYQLGQAKKQTIEQNAEIARLAHEINRAYCQACGDNSQVPWEQAPDWQRESAINGVKFHMENEATPEQSHENWLKDKAADGWKHGPVKDADKKEHPCFCAYDQLPVEQRVKDYLFRAIVNAHKETK